MPPGAPDLAVTIAIYIAAAASLLVALGGLVTALTFFRRCVRHCAITWRAEGWGSPRHPNQDREDGFPVPPAVDLINRFRKESHPASQALDKGGESQRPAA